MKKLWTRISNLGISSGEKTLFTRTLILGNQLNAIILLVCILILVFLSIMNVIERTPYGIGSLRVLIAAVYLLLNMLISSLGFPRFTKLSLIFVPSLILIILPTLIGFVEEESFTYYPFALIALSILTQILLVPLAEKKWFIAGVSYYFILLIFIEPLLIACMSEEFEIVPIIQEIFPYTKMVQIAVFLFIQFAIFYLRRLNYKFEQEVTTANRKLSLKNRKLEETLNELNESQNQIYQLERLSTIGSLTAGMAHEMNNPLNYISGGLDILEGNDGQQPMPEERTNAIRIIRKGLERATGLVKSLLLFTHQEAAVKKDTDLHEILDNTVLFLRHTFPKGVFLYRSYDLKEKVPIYQDKVQKVIHSILENAVLAIRDKSRLSKEFIRIKTYSEDCEGGRCACIVITNSGPPISSEIFPRLYDPFFTTREAGKGTGLGLSVSYMFMKEHKGTIEAFNGKEGVTFILKFPLSETSRLILSNRSEYQGK